MLNEKDYCDYDTCVALKEVGCDQHYDKYKETNSKGEYIFDWFTLYEAQKWLREEKGIDVCIEVNTKNNRLSDKYYTVCISYMSRIKREYQYLNENFGSYEEALLEGIKEAIKILKEK